MMMMGASQHVESEWQVEGDARRWVWSRLKKVRTKAKARKLEVRDASVRAQHMGGRFRNEAADLELPCPHRGGAGCARHMNTLFASICGGP